MKDNTTDMLKFWINLFLFGFVFGIIANDMNTGFIAAFALMFGQSFILFLFPSMDIWKEVKQLRKELNAFKNSKELNLRDV